MSNAIPNRAILISLDTIVLTMPKAKQLTQSAIDSEIQILQDVSGMPTSELDRIGEDQIVANKRCITCTQSRRKSLVVRVAKNDNATTIRSLTIGMIHGKQTEIMIVISIERMNLVLNGEAIS